MHISLSVLGTTIALIGPFKFRWTIIVLHRVVVFYRFRHRFDTCRRQILLGIVRPSINAINLIPDKH